MRILLLIIAVVVLTVVAVTFFRENPGYVFIGFGQYSIETDLAVFIPHPLDLRTQPGIPDRSVGKPGRISFPGLVLVIGRRGDLQMLADRLDPVFRALFVDERDHHFGRRSSSAWAK